MSQVKKDPTMSGLFSWTSALAIVADMLLLIGIILLAATLASF